MSIPDEFPLVDDDFSDLTSKPNKNNIEQVGDKKHDQSQKGFWVQLREFGLAEPAVRLGTNVFAIGFVVLVAWAMSNYYLNSRISEVELPQRSALAAPLDVGGVQAEASAPIYQNGVVPLLPALFAQAPFDFGIPRLAMLYTQIPTRPRVDVLNYTIVQGDTLFSVADRFGLRPETILWGNREILNDNPNQLYVGQELNILPLDGVYHQWTPGENLGKVAEFYGVTPQAVIEYPGNRFDEFNFDVENPDIEAGQYLIIPGGERAFVDFGPPRITRNNPAVARTYGPGYCGSVADGALGTGAFAWPTQARFLSGYDYSPSANHWGLDIDGDTGDPVWAADSGVVVFAGWSNSGYGYLVVIDHGEWQSLYAHMDNYFVSCGQSVFQGTQIGTIGNTGNSYGSHLHFELIYGSAKVNPWNYLP